MNNNNPTTDGIELSIYDVLGIMLKCVGVITLVAVVAMVATVLIHFSNWEYFFQWLTGQKLPPWDLRSTV